MNYKKTYVPKKGYTPLCEIGKCSLKELEFGIIELSDGETLDFDTRDRETAFIILNINHCSIFIPLNAFMLRGTARCRSTARGM